MVKARAIRQAEVDARDAAEAEERVNDEMRAYLRETDWYVIREVETGKPMPVGIRKWRSKARTKVKGERGWQGEPGLNQQGLL